jgi:hypothetical protein
MEPKKIYSFSYKIDPSQKIRTDYSLRDRITDFVDHLHTVQADMIEQAVEMSKYKEANEVIAYIKGKL